MDYLKFSKKRRLEADKILLKTDLFKRLERFGKVRIIGSYSLDLMIKPDIDFVVRVGKNSEVNKVIKGIIKICKNIKNVSIKKIVDRKKFELNGKSLHLYYQSREVWGIDIFVSTNNFSSYNRLSKKVKDKMTIKKKRAILKLKYYFYKKKMKVSGVPYRIYISVLDEGVSTKKELYEYLKKKHEK